MLTADRSRLAFVPPMLPSLVEAPPAGTGWLHEIKHDGYRTELVIEGNSARAFTRRGLDWSDDYRPIVEAARSIKCRSAVIDGEMIVQDSRGVSDFSLFRSSIRRAPERLVLVAFDLLHLNGEDLRNRPIEQRRDMLQALVGAAGPLMFSEALEGEGAEIFAAADAMGLEGIVSKRKGSPYRSGKATAWLKSKTFAVSTLDVIGIDRSATGAPTALLARAGEDGPEYVGDAFVTLPRRCAKCSGATSTSARFQVRRSKDFASEG